MTRLMIPPGDEPEHADEILDTLHKACTELGITYFVYGGTALGFYRDGGYIKLDNDLDIVVVSTEEEYHNLWHRLATLPEWNDGSGLRKGPIQLDLHYTDRNLPHYVIPSWRPMAYTFQGFDIVSHRGRDYRLPHPVEKYLVWEFGKAWNVPVSREVWGTVDTILQALLLEETD